MTTTWTCSAYDAGDEYPFSMECQVDDVVYRLDLAISEDRITGVGYNQRDERCGSCLRYRKLCRDHDILDDDDPPLIARAIAAFRQGGGASYAPPSPRPSPPPSDNTDDYSGGGGSKKRKAGDGAAVARVNQIVEELRGQARLIRQLSERSDFFEEHYQEAHTKHNRTRQMLLCTIKQFRQAFNENAELQGVVRRLQTENVNLKRVIDALQQGSAAPEEDISSIEDALEESKKLLATFYGKAPPEVLDDSHVPAVDIDTPPPGTESGSPDGGSTKKRKAEDGTAVARVNQIIEELRGHASRIRELSQRSDFYEDHYRKAYADYVKTSDMLAATLKMYRNKKFENIQLQERMVVISRENDRLRESVNAMQQEHSDADLDFDRLDDAMDTLRRTVSDTMMGKPPLHLSTEEDVERTTPENIQRMIDAVTDDHSITDEDMVDRLKSLAL